MRAARMHLRGKGVAPEVAEAAAAVVQQDEEENEQTRCRRLLDKRDPDGARFGDRRIWQRHLRYLHGKGYAMETVQAVMRQRGREGEP